MEADRLWAGAAATLAVASALAVLGPVLGEPTGLALGGAQGEGAAHLWGLWSAAANLPNGSPFLRVADAAFPAGFRADLMDPVHLLVLGPLAAVGGAGGATLGWNLLPAASLLLGGLGGWLLGARLGFSAPARTALAVLVAASPYVCGGVVPVGRSEQLAGAWLVLHLAALHGAIRDGGVGWGLGAVATLALQAHAGWRPLMFVVVLEVPLALAWAVTASGRGAALARAVAIGVAAAVLTVPLLRTHLGAAPWWAAVDGWPSPFQVPGEAAYLSDLAPGVSLPGWQGDPPANVGLVALLAALGGAVLRPRRAGPWLAFGVALWSLALGLRIGLVRGGAFGWGPAAYLSWVLPPLRAVQGWPRLAPLALVPLAVAAGHAVDGLAGRRRVVVALAVAVLGLVEGAAWRPLGRPTFPVVVSAPGAAALAALPAGALLELPLVLPTDAEVQGRVDAALLGQRLHGRPTTLAPSPYPVTATDLAGPLGLAGRPGPPLDCDPGLAARLAGRGVGGVVLHLDWLDPRGARMTLDGVRAQLGAPDEIDEAAALWAIPGRRPDPCGHSGAAGVGEGSRR